MYVDTHCHIFKDYFDNIDELILKLEDSSVSKIIVNGVDMKSNLEVLELVKKYDIVYGAIGFHPTELDEYNDECLSWLEEHLSDNKIVALGEIGLDYHYENTNKDKQLDVFKKQLEIAERYNKPVIIHSRDSIQDTYNILKKFKLKGSMHCYSGSLEMAREFVKLGYLLGIGGVVTYNNAKNVKNVVKNIELEYILLETDSPYLSPVPHRKEINTPCNIPLIAKEIAVIKGMNDMEIGKITSLNSERLFDF